VSELSKAKGPAKRRSPKIYFSGGGRTIQKITRRGEKKRAATWRKEKKTTLTGKGLFQMGVVATHEKQGNEHILV